MPAAAAGIMVGGQLLSAYLAHRAANKAAKTLTTAETENRERTDQMTRYILQMLQDREKNTAAMNSPYLAMGQGALRNLSRFPGINVPNVPQGPSTYPTTTLPDLDTLFPPTRPR